MGTIDTISGKVRSIAGESRAVAGIHFRLGRACLRVLVWIEARLERQRSRRQLLEMSDAQLKDIGLSRGEAYREGVRPFWE